MDATSPLAQDSWFQNFTCIHSLQSQFETPTAHFSLAMKSPFKQLSTWTPGNLNPQIKTLTAPGTLRPEWRGLRPKPNGRYDPMETKKWEPQVAIEVVSQNTGCGMDESTGWSFNDAKSSDFFVLAYGTRKSTTVYSCAYVYLPEATHCNTHIWHTPGKWHLYNHKKKLQGCTSWLSWTRDTRGRLFQKGMPTTVSSGEADYPYIVSKRLLKCGHGSLTIIVRKPHELGKHRSIPVIWRELRRRQKSTWNPWPFRMQG